MTKAKQQHAETARPTVRCAIYTRKSTDHGLELEFNSLDNQRECCEAFVKSQAGEGWLCLPTRYDDGGFSGGTTDRPALKQLLADVEAGLVNCVVVYKHDRLSRSLIDFTKLMETFGKYGVSLVAVTQQFNTATSTGRLLLHMLLSFAQFEREIISERTRDKIAGSRRRGKWMGGHQLLGYDVDSKTCKLLVNAAEADQVRQIYALYAEHEGLVPVVQELERRGWRTKSWTTRKGSRRGGKRFTKTSLHKLLTNVVYAGKVRHKDQVYTGEHEAIIDGELWQKVQALLARNGRAGGAAVRNQFGALLRGLLHCKACGCAMTPVHTTRKNGKRYRYYVCVAAQKRGWASCPAKSLPAGEIERLVVERLRCVGKDPTVLAHTLAVVRAQAEGRVVELRAEQARLAHYLAAWHAEVRGLAQQVTQGDDVLPGLVEVQERIAGAERRASEVDAEAKALAAGTISEAEVATALASFMPVWEALAPREQARLVGLLVESVEYDGVEQKVAITFQPSGIRALADEVAGRAVKGA